MFKKSGSKKTKLTSSSGAKGGPSTGRGMNYEIDVTVQQTLDYMSRALCAPHRVWEVRIEPRVSSADNLTSWDVGFDPDDTLFEVKLKPNRDDILEWLQRVRTDGTGDGHREFHLVYSKGAGKHLDNLDQLIRIAREADGDKTEFNSKIKGERIGDHPYLETLGDQAYDLLRRMRMDQFPEYLLKSNIDFRARQLAGEDGGRRLREYLFTKFYEAVPHRKSFSVIDLIDEARTLGIHFQPPASVDPNDISVTASSALLILQTCTAGMPTEVLAEALGCSTSVIESELEGLRLSHVVALDEGLWSMKPLPTVLTSSNAQEVLARSLSSLLTFIENSTANTNIRALLGNVISLAKECRLSHPSLVAGVFPKLDKRLKRIGNKRLVWFLANLSIQAARSLPHPNREVVEAEARSLICGTSWAFQRLHKIPKARVHADEAYVLAENMRLDRTLAFCLKCLGRLCRMEAEAMADGEEKRSKLRQSVNLLREAIEKFEQLVEFGPNDPEVGDCHSLLGRTYLVADELHEADAAVQRATMLIVDETSKDFIDLEILKADLEALKGNTHAAAQIYDRVVAISGAADPEISEMRARAFLRRGANRELAGDMRGAKSDYKAARQIWEVLQDEQFAAVAAWEEIRISQSLSSDTLALLVEECGDVRVRVEVVNLYHDELAAQVKGALARRSNPPKGYWLQLIKNAKERVAMRGERSETEW